MSRTFWTFYGIGIIAGSVIVWAAHLWRRWRR